MEKLTYNGKPGLKVTVSHKKAKASMIITYTSTKARNETKTKPSKAKLLRDLKSMPSMWEKQA